MFFETDHALSVVLPRFLFVIVQTSLEIMLISASVSSCAKMRWDWGEGSHAQYTYKAGGRKASQQMSIFKSGCCNLEVVAYTNYIPICPIHVFTVL